MSLTVNQQRRRRLTYAINGDPAVPTWLRPETVPSMARYIEAHTRVRSQNLEQDQLQGISQVNPIDLTVEDNVPDWESEWATVHLPDASSPNPMPPIPPSFQATRTMNTAALPSFKTFVSDSIGKRKRDDSDDEDDSRSVVSSTFAAHQLGSESRAFNLSHLPQSPYAASQLFGRNDSFSLFSIAETKRPHAGSEESGMGSRSATPDLVEHLGHIPFRRALTEEEKESAVSDQFDRDHTPLSQRSKTPIDFPVTVPVSDGSSSTIAFPVSSPDQPISLESPSVVRSRYNSFADLHGGPPFIRSRVHSRLGEIEVGEPGWRTRRESTA